MPYVGISSHVIDDIVRCINNNHIKSTSIAPAFDPALGRKYTTWCDRAISTRWMIARLLI